MKKRLLLLLPSSFLFVAAALATDRDLDALVDGNELRATVRDRNEGALLNESMAVEQARTQARSRSGYGLELRPSVGDSDVGLALRVYLPDRWGKKRLREQLTLAAQSEQLRVAALEWQQIMAVYRDFCTYRMLRKQIARIDEELQFIEPYLAEADRRVEQRQLAVAERTRLYGTFLSLLNDRNQTENELTDTQRKLRLVLGPRADLEKLSGVATIDMPTQLEIETQLRRALENRADYRQLDVNARAMQMAEEAARSEDGFRLKFIQPSYGIDYEDGGDRWELSAAFILPWGTRSPDIAVYRNQQALSLAAMAQQKRIIADKMRVLFRTADSYYTLVADRNRRTQPLLDRMNRDLAEMGQVPLDQVRNILSIRERMLETDLQAAETECRKETLAVDLAEELGGR